MFTSMLITPERIYTEFEHLLHRVGLCFNVVTRQQQNVYTYFNKGVVIEMFEEPSTPGVWNRVSFPSNSRNQLATWVLFNGEPHAITNVLDNVSYEQAKLILERLNSL